MNSRIKELLMANVIQFDMNSFIRLIFTMNQMYELPVNKAPAKDMDLAEQLQNFKRILADELNEIDDIIMNPEHAADIRSKMAAGNIDEVVLDAHVALADLLADIVVYCFSESLKHGIYLPAILHNVMTSNFSKLGEDGKPIKDANGKFLKGPGYIPPEEVIKDLLPKLWADVVGITTEREDDESIH